MFLPQQHLLTESHVHKYLPLSKSANDQVLQRQSVSLYPLQ